MKLTVSSKLSALLGALGVPVRGELKSSFPTCVSAAYLPVWDEFIKTRIVKDIQKKYEKALSRYYVCAGFVSYIYGIDRRAISKPVDLLSSVGLYNPGDRFRTIANYLGTNRLITGLKLSNSDHRHSIHVEESNFLNAFLNPTTSGILEYKVQGRAPLDKYLGILTPTLFKKLPDELLREVKGKKRNILRPHAQADANTGWVSLLNKDRLTLDMARAQFGTVLFRYSFSEDAILFHGGASPEKLEVAIKRVQERAIIVP